MNRPTMRRHHVPTRSATRGTVRRASASGFTLVELMIAVVVVAIISAIAFPSFMDSIRKSRRSDAFAAIGKIQQAQERWRANAAAFSTSKSDLKVGDDPPLYDLTISAPDANDAAASLATGYIVTAIGKGTQADDQQCKKLSARLVNGNISYAGCYDCSTFTYEATHRCWAR